MSTISEAAAILSKLGAKKGGEARAAKLSKARIVAIARKAGIASGRAKRARKKAENNS